MVQESVSGHLPGHQAREQSRLRGQLLEAPLLNDPAVDAMITALAGAKTREDLTAAARALDRILMWNYYVLPLYHDAGQRIAYWRKLSRPETVPVYGVRLETFWATNPR